MGPTGLISRDVIDPAGNQLWLDRQPLEEKLW